MIKRGIAIKFLLTLIVTVVIVLFAFVMKKYQEFHRELISFHKIQLNDQQSNLYYLLGQPTVVYVPVEDTFFHGAALRTYYVNGIEGDKNTMPSETKIEDYLDWSYEGSNFPCRFDITFDSTKRVTSMAYFSSDDNSNAWGPVAGVYNGDSEEKVLGLGRPTLDSIDHVTRTIEYSDIGLQFYLTKGKVYMVSLNKPQKGDFAIFRRFLNSKL